MNIRKINYKILLALCLGIILALSSCKQLGLDKEDNDDENLLILAALAVAANSGASYTGSCNISTANACIDYYSAYTTSDVQSVCSSVSGTVATSKCSAPTIGSCKGITDGPQVGATAGTGNYKAVGFYYTGSSITESVCTGTNKGTWSTGSQSW